MEQLSIAPEVAQPPKSRKRLLLRLSLAVTAVLFAYLAWQCGSGLMQGHQLADKAVTQFHTELNQGDFEQIYSEADDGFRQAGKKEELIKFLDGVHRKLGNAGATSLSNMNVNATTNGTFITTLYSTNYANGAAAETFTWIKKNGSLRLYGYNIQSNAFIVNQ